MYQNKTEIHFDILKKKKTFDIKKNIKHTVISFIQYSAMSKVLLHLHISPYISYKTIPVIKKKILSTHF
jgi:hypothetical protein